MQDSERTALIACLERLGDPSDEAALAAAREVHRRVGEAGEGWSDLLVAARAAPTAAPAAASEDAASEDAATIDRLLARDDISAATREELTALRRDLASGPLDPMDGDYLRALAARLGAA